MDSDPHSPASLEQIRELLQRQLTLAEDSNKIIHDMRTWGRVAFVAKVIIWTFVLLVPLLLIPYIAPTIKGMGSSGTSTGLTGGSLFGYPSPTEIQDILHPSK